MNRAMSWDAVDGWHLPARQLKWDAVRDWMPAFERLTGVAARRLDEVLCAWDERFADLGGDPARTDWESFRPLRRSREEDWSDWLAFLIERSETGQFPARLFASDTSDARTWRATKVDREVAAQGYRADLVVHFENEEWLHLEVKVGDQHFEKTPATGQALRRELVGRCRGDWLLLPDADRAVWKSGQRPRGASSIRVVTWTELARAVRASLVDAKTEKLTWRAWAFAFLGALEQDLLGFPPVPQGKTRASAREIERLRFLESMEGT